MPGFEVFGDEEKQQVLEVFDTGILFRYEFGAERNDVYKVREFEQAFADYTGAVSAQAVTSGTAALKVALRRFCSSPNLCNRSFRSKMRVRKRLAILSPLFLRFLRRAA